IPSQLLGKTWEKSRQFSPDSARRHGTETLAASITKAASHQTYYTVRFLVDRSRVEDAYRAYAYFRWVDDWLDRPGISKLEHQNFVARQRCLIYRCYSGLQLPVVNAEEQMLIDLINSDEEFHSGLRSYIENMMAVMSFDAARRGNVVSGAELHRYTLS